MKRFAYPTEELAKESFLRRKVRPEQARLMEEDKALNPFSPGYVSQIKPFAKQPAQRRPDLKQAASPLESINPDTKDDVRERRWRNMKARI